MADEERNEEQNEEREDEERDEQENGGDGDDGEPVGIVSLGDLAIEADDDSVLKEISAADPNA